MKCSIPAFSKASVFSLALLLNPLTPAWSDYVDDISQLYAAGNPQAAFEKALEHLAEGEGDPRFDFAYGVAAIDAGFTSQGVFALDRVLILRPDDQHTRLEVARGYFILEQYNRARREFETVLASNPPENVQQNIRHFINTIRTREGRYKSTASLYASVDMGWDSNINSAPLTPEFISPVLGVGTLSSTSTNIGDWFTDTNAGTSMTIPIAPGRYFVGKLDFNKRMNDRFTQFDTGAITVSVGLTENVGNIKMNLTLKGQDYYLDNKRYRSVGGFSADWSNNITDQLQITGFTSLLSQSYPSLSGRDSRLLNTGFGLVKAFSGELRTIGFASVFIGTETPRLNTAAAEAAVHRDIKGLGGGLQVSINDTTSLTASATWQNSRYNGDDVIFVATRRDDFYSSGLTLKHLIDDRLSVSAGYTFSKNDSNIAINRYDREVISLGLRFEY